MSGQVSAEMQLVEYALLVVMGVILITMVLGGALCVTLYPRWQVASLRRATANCASRLRVVIDPIKPKALPGWCYLMVGFGLGVWLTASLFADATIFQYMIMANVLVQLLMFHAPWMQVASELLADDRGIYFSGSVTRKNRAGFVPWSNIHRHWLGDHMLGFTAHRLDRPHSGSFVFGISLHEVDDARRARLDELFRERLQPGPRLHSEPREAAVA